MERDRLERAALPSVEELRRLKKIIEEGRIKNPVDPLYYNAHFVKAQLPEITPLLEASWKTSA